MNSTGGNDKRFSQLIYTKLQTLQANHKKKKIFNLSLSWYNTTLAASMWINLREKKLRKKDTFHTQVYNVFSMTNYLKRHWKSVAGNDGRWYFTYFMFYVLFYQLLYIGLPSFLPDANINYVVAQIPWLSCRLTHLTSVSWLVSSKSSFMSLIHELQENFKFSYQYGRYKINYITT